MRILTKKIAGRYNFPQNRFYGSWSPQRPPARVRVTGFCNIYSQIQMEPVHKIYLTLIFLCSLLFLVMIYVLYVRHENTIENWKDLIDECYNRQERLKQQELFEAQYNVSLTVGCRSKPDFLIYIETRFFSNHYVDRK